MPDAACAVEIAKANGWLDEEWTPTVRALADPVAGILTCGGIDRRWWVPELSPDSEMGEATIEAALKRVGGGVTRIDRTAESDGDGRTDELRPREHASILGRALHAACAPIGEKNADSVSRLPDWLDTAPPAVRASFAELLVRELGAERPQKATRAIQAARPRECFEQVSALIEDVTGESATVGDAGVTISADTVRKLGTA